MKTPEQEIDDIVSNMPDWRGEMLARLRRVVKGVDSDIREAVKWKKPSKPEGVPVWECSGILCVGEALKSAVRLTFPKGAQLADPKLRFNTRLDSKSVRAIDFFENDTIDEAALKSLVQGAVKLNREKTK